VPAETESLSDFRYLVLSLTDLRTPFSSGKNGCGPINTGSDLGWMTTISLVPWIKTVFESAICLPSQTQTGAFQPAWSLALAPTIRVAIIGEIPTTDCLRRGWEADLAERTPAS